MLTLVGTAASAALSAPGPEPTLASTRVLVLRPTSTTVEPATLDVIASLLSVALADERGAPGGRLDVVTAGDVEKMANLAAERSTVGCDSSSCLGEIAAAMGTRYVIFGDANKLGSLTIITLNVFDADESRSIIRKSVELDDVAQLPSRLRAIVPALAAPLLAPPNSSRALTTPEPSKSPLRLVWTIVGVTAGLAIAGVSVGYDVTADSSKNFTLDLVDFVGPGGVVVGLGVAVVGVFFSPFSDPTPIGSVIE